MDRIIVIGDADTALGFKLAGVSDGRAATAQTAETLMQDAISDPNSGIIIVTQEIMQQLSAKTRKHLQTLSKPVVIEIPGKRDLSTPGQSISQMVKKAIGVELK